MEQKKVYCHQKTLFLFLLLCFTDNSKYLHNDYNNILNNNFSMLISESKECFVIGDLNVNYLKRNDNIDIKQMFRLYGFHQLIQKPTRITVENSSLIDLIFTNTPVNVAFHDVIPTNFSDHEMIYCVRKLNALKY